MAVLSCGVSLFYSWLGDSTLLLVKSVCEAVPTPAGQLFRQS